ncbi:MAG: hypothetical protein Q8P72_02355 [Candidatus Roizmanbacteria bacterium]|nr:hypothetical protein [Candidatus Roizmanbacteria bacterium]
MNITSDQIFPILLWVPIASLFINFFLITFLIIIIQKGKLKPKEQQEIEKQMMETIKQAEERTTEIIEDATNKAKEIIQQAQGTKQLLDEKLDKMVNDTTDIAQNELDAEKAKIVNKFTESYSGLVQEFEGETQSLMAALQHDSRDIRKTFSESVQKSTVDVLKELKDTAQKQLIDIDADIKEYRDATFKKIDEHANTLIKQIVTDYFNTELTNKNQESILTKTFEKFKDQITK